MLQRMRRGYTREAYLELVQRIRECEYTLRKWCSKWCGHQD